MSPDKNAVTKLNNVFNVTPPLSTIKEMKKTTKKVATAQTVPFKIPPLFSFLELRKAETNPPTAMLITANKADDDSPKSNISIAIAKIITETKLVKTPTPIDKAYIKIFSF